MNVKNRNGAAVMTTTTIIVLWAAVFTLGMPALDLIFRIFKIL